jgi:hypothetical protein
MQNHFPITHEFHTQIARNFVLFCLHDFGDHFESPMNSADIAYELMMERSMNKAHQEN